MRLERRKVEHGTMDCEDEDMLKRKVNTEVAADRIVGRNQSYSQVVVKFVSLFFSVLEALSFCGDFAHLWILVILVTLKI